MSTKRSPVLGYNHNFMHRGIVFHVQTEDSGVDNPHVFTHLFHGGVIVSSRRLDYDRDSREADVKSLMQAQHKAILRELKKGEFDAKISVYFAKHPDLQPVAGEVLQPVAGEKAAGEVLQPVAGEILQPVAGEEASGEAAPEAVTGEGAAPSARGEAVGGGAAAAGGVDDAGATASFSALVIGDDTGATASFPAWPRESGDAAEALGTGMGEGAAADDSRDTDFNIQVPPAAAAEEEGALTLAADDVAAGDPEVTFRPAAPSPQAQPAPPPVAAAPPQMVPVSPEAEERRKRESAGTYSRVRGGESIPIPRAGAQPPAIPRDAGRRRGNVVVSRPAVVIGGPAGRAHPAPSLPRAEASLFSHEYAAEKSLDEVILAYLSEDAPEE